MHDFVRREHGGGRPRPRCNMSDADRWGSMIGGAALTAYGLSRFRRGGWILAGFGVLLFRRGATGHCFTYDLLGFGTALSDMVDGGSPLAERGPRESRAASGEPQP